MAGRLSSGDEGLDLILCGGLPANGINLITGLPGSGKTPLCQQFSFAGNNRGAAGDLPVHGLGAVREDAPLRPDG